MGGAVRKLSFTTGEPDYPLFVDAKAHQFFGKPEAGIPALARQLLLLLQEQAEVESVSAPPLHQVPDGPHFAYYLPRLEQLLAVRYGSMFSHCFSPLFIDQPAPPDRRP